MISIQINSQQLKATERLFVRLDRKMTQPAPMLKEIGETMVASVLRNFEAEGRPTKWAPLSPMTIARRRNQNKGSIKILQDTGRLKNSITYDITRYGGTAVAIGTNVEYGRIHQLGGKAHFPAHIEKVRSHIRVMGSKSVKVAAHNRKVKARTAVIPQRKYLMFQKQDIQDIRSIILEHLQNTQNADNN